VGFECLSAVGEDSCMQASGFGKGGGSGPEEDESPEFIMAITDMGASAGDGCINLDEFIASPFFASPHSLSNATAEYFFAISHNGECISLEDIYILMKDFPAFMAGYDSCAYAKNDVCDEPNICLPGTDTSDCTLQQSGVGTCDGVNETLSSADLNNDTAWEWGTCWAACLIEYPDTLVAINGPGDVEGECVCQDKCEQRFDCGFSTSLTNLTFNMTSVPCVDDGERVCEGHEYKEIFCGRIGCCTWDSVEGECMSNVGQNSCQPDNESPEFIMATVDIGVSGGDQCITLAEFFAAHHTYLGFRTEGGSGIGGGSGATDVFGDISTDGSCISLEDLYIEMEPFDSCEFSRDKICDDPGHLNYDDASQDVCAKGTDTSDCTAGSGSGSGSGSGAAEDNSCAYANNDICNEPNICFPGTDTADCPDSCLHANNGYCDEPGHANYDNAGATCAAGTDTTDCSGPDSCLEADNDVCDDKTHAKFTGSSGSCAPGTDTTDCEAAGPDSCIYKDNGNCDDQDHHNFYDVGGLCAPGTDTIDCEGGQTSTSSTSSSSSSGSSGPL